MKCDEAYNYTMKWLDGEITKEDFSALKLHTACCEKCSDSFDVFERMFNDIGFFDIETASDLLKSEIAKEIEQADASDYINKNNENSLTKNNKKAAFNKKFSKIKKPLVITLVSFLFTTIVAILVKIFIDENAHN